MPADFAMLLKTSRKRNGFFTPDSPSSRKLDLVMQGAYVVHLGAPQEQSREELEGRIEEVDIGKSLRFHSGGELIQFLRERLKVARAELERDK